jgi:hypothetical protein
MEYYMTEYVQAYVVHHYPMDIGVKGNKREADYSLPSSSTVACSFTPTAH